jgi:DNA-binding NtrC family response regulator
MTDAPRRRVLIVDDEKKIAETLAMIFSAQGYDGRATYSAEDALRLIGEWLPDLAVLDVNLGFGRMNGIDLGIQMKAAYPTCKLLLFSGNTSTGELLADAESKGHFFEIMAKPVHPQALLDAARQMLNK